MRLETVEIQNNQGAVLSLSMRDISSGYSIRTIEGLGPVAAEIVTSKFASIDGEHYQASRRGTRNIVMTLGLENVPGVGSPMELRSDLYSFLIPKSEVTLRFMHESPIDTFTVQTTGRVETLEAPIFGKEPIVVVSIICFDPDFKALTPAVYSGNTVNTATDKVMVYPGSVPGGFVFTLNVDRSIGGFTIQNTTPSGTYMFEFIYALLAGDVVEIDTRPNSKRAYLTRGGVPRSILQAASPTAPWFGLQPGSNSFRVTVAGLPIPYSVACTPRYGGL